jgi:hypothetical protein
MISGEARKLILERSHAVQKTTWVCGFLDRAPGHSSDFTTGSGTYCSTCHLRIYNEDFDGKFEIKAVSDRGCLQIDELATDGGARELDIEQAWSEWRGSGPIWTRFGISDHRSHDIAIEFAKHLVDRRKR